MRRAHRALYRGEELFGAVRARGDHVEDIRGRAVLLRAARAVAGRGRRPGGQRLCEGRAAATSDGVCGGGAEADLDFAGRQRWVMVEPENLVLEQLRAIRGEIGKLMNEMQTMRVEMTAIRQHMAACIEKRLELADQS